MCSVICFNHFSILFVSVYLSIDLLFSNLYEFNFVLSSIHALKQLFFPGHVIYGGDWKFTSYKFTFSVLC